VPFTYLLLWRHSMLISPSLYQGVHGWQDFFQHEQTLHHLMTDVASAKLLFIVYKQCHYFALTINPASETCRDAMLTDVKGAWACWADSVRYLPPGVSFQPSYQRGTTWGCTKMSSGSSPCHGTTICGGYTAWTSCGTGKIYMFKNMLKPQLIYASPYAECLWPHFRDTVIAP